MQSVDDKAVFVFAGDPNTHHSEWLESESITDRYGRDALDFCNMSGCEQLVSGPTHIAGNRLNLVMTNVTVIVVVVVVVVVVGQTVGSISSKTLAYDCLCTLGLWTASMIATS